MHKIAAQYIFPINAKPVKYGVLTIDDDGTILDLSQSADNLEELPSVEFYNGIIVPGFVNAHCHLELSHMRGELQQGKGMGAFCEGITLSRNKFTVDEQLHAIITVDEQMQHEGIVAVGDISNGSISFDAKQKSALYYHTFVECLGLDACKADTAIEYAINIQRQAQALGLAASITPHAPYSMSEKLFTKSVALAQTGGILSIHNQESSDEMELFAKGTSNLRKVFEQHSFKFDETILECKNPINRILKYIDELTYLLLIHNVYTSAEDVDRVTGLNKNTSWVLCPNSNLYIENTLPPVTMLNNKNVNIAIGTDSLSSNTSISIMEELKTIAANFPEIPINTLLYWATLGGAKALMKDSALGSFDKGKRPGVTLIEGIDFENMRFTSHTRSSKLL